MVKDTIVRNGMSTLTHQNSLKRVQKDNSGVASSLPSVEQQNTQQPPVREKEDKIFQNGGYYCYCCY